MYAQRARAKIGMNSIKQICFVLSCFISENDAKVKTIKRLNPKSLVECLTVCAVIACGWCPLASDVKYNVSLDVCVCVCV